MPKKVSSKSKPATKTAPKPAKKVAKKPVAKPAKKSAPKATSAKPQAAKYEQSGAPWWKQFRPM